MEVQNWITVSLYVRHQMYSPLLTHILSAARHRITSWWGSVCCEPAMNFSSSCPVNFPPSLVPQATYYFMFLSFAYFFHRGLSFTYQFCFSLWCTGFIPLFRDGETILHTRLEPTHLSRFQTNRDWGVSQSFVFAHTSTLNSWSLKEISQKKNSKQKNPDSISLAAHTCRETGNDSEHPLPFDVLAAVWMTSILRPCWPLTSPVFTLLMGGEREHGR